LSYFGIILSSVFAANALLSSGFGASRLARGNTKHLLPSFIALSLFSLFVAVILWTARRFLFIPFGLSALEVVLYMSLIVPLMKFISRVAAQSPGAFLRKVAESGDELAISSLVFGIALLSSKASYTLYEAAIAALASSLGYAAASELLGAIRERLELSDVPTSFKGAPTLLLSAGLMAMAFMGIDAVLIKNFVG